MSAPSLTDHAALLRNRARALKQGADLFLHEDAAAEIEERLSEVNKTFTAPAVVTGFPGPWAEILPDARIVADEQTLALDPGSHDLVIHALSLHWANDPVGQLIQCRRALKPDGLFIGVLFGGRTLSELRASLAEAESHLAGGLSARVLPMAEIRDLGALLQRAGFALPVADAAKKTVTYATMFHLIADLRAMGEGNALSLRPRRTAPRALFPEAARVYSASFPAEGHRIAATFEMIYLTGWAPDESQQKPLRPGSATARLADALGATETPLGDKPLSGEH
ncbi:methyltransferase domain-containing protein [Defluviimonas sp. SAOS-178_SWC]|uniref:methyltransferase domain-containing protein n=1 Tax=Defluviimonas sp. SAOS-178_SWC TaxID=3121287 RepID=UPI003221D124